MLSSGSMAFVDDGRSVKRKKEELQQQQEEEEEIKARQMQQQQQGRKDGRGSTEVEELCQKVSYSMHGFRSYGSLDGNN